MLKKAFPDIEKIAYLDKDAVIYLVNKTGMETRRAVELVRAARMAKEFQQPLEVFYALFNAGLPQTMAALMRQSPDVIRHAIQRAIERKLIPSMDVEEQTRALYTRFKEKAVEMALQPLAEEKRLSLGLLLSKVLDSKEQSRRFLTTYADHDGPIEEFWGKIKEDDVLGEKASELQLIMQLGALSLNHQPMLDHLYQMKQDGIIQHFGDLARYDEEDWKGVIRNNDIGASPEVPGENDEEKTANYARLISNIVEDAFPESFIAHRLPEDDPVRQFLIRNNSFHLKTTPITRHLRDQGSNSKRRQSSACVPCSGSIALPLATGP